ncbi:hypothetical protein [Enteractinococcus coprophilus]|uniref:Uncharacterized protein n=1 Tax=Enteractinococcus coprophilus TaxID=1027633 RepID=A0A543AP33_9MICC|nr:hypothetical protein [Enteractinococcus coprophilus]TQL74340.1 hypothetical protein FB556_0803 [Enteractinococcus coprophilus]
MKISARFYKTAAILSVVGLALTGCIDDYDQEDTAPPGDGETQGSSVTIDVFNGWDEGIAVSEL